MSTNPSNTQTDIAGRKTVIVDSEKNIEFEFSRINRSKEYDDIVIRILNEELNEVYGKLNNPLFIRDDALYSYYKTNKPEYIKIVNAIGTFISAWIPVFSVIRFLYCVSDPKIILMEGNNFFMESISLYGVSLSPF